ncbi:UNVERIFIED_CONTAM: hypothetical protein GTU68_053403, partial [Idotea baltica]|nr:hypothetical protein [Idotea baltica]
MLCILDGWGIGSQDAGDAIHQANTPFFDHLVKSYPNSQLSTFGNAVGLPDGQMGNSEVGHTNLGAGRVVWQDLAKIDKSLNSGELYQSVNWLNMIKQIQNCTGKFHLMGLLSDGGVHSHINHLTQLIVKLDQLLDKEICLHLFSDGRDTSPGSIVTYIDELKALIATRKKIKISSIGGRYYSMDRDQRWERIKKGYDSITGASSLTFTNVSEYIQATLDKKITDEFILPAQAVGGNGKAIGPLQNGDSLLCFNFRTDRCRQISRALTQENFPVFGMQKLDIQYFTMTQYDASFRDIGILFQDKDLTDTLGEVIARNGKRQVRMAETEKYPHVTFFFSGGREIPFDNEHRIMVNSPKVATYDLQPEMSADLLSQQATKYIAKERPEFVCLNFANPDMVGHTGVIEAVVKAVESTDKAMQNVIETALENGYAIFLLADHGNADYMINPDGSPNTYHSVNPVPL